MSAAIRPGLSLRLAPVIIALCIAIPLANLLGWLLGIRAFVSIGEGLPAMVPVTALLSLLIACGLAVQRRWPHFLQLTVAFPLAAILLGMAIESCYTAGAAPWPFVLAKSGQESMTSLSSPVTAGMFTALGCALLMLADRAKVKGAQALALAVAMLAVLNLGGYVFRDTFLFTFLPGRGTSILTTLQAILLSAGILFAHPGDGLMAAITGASPSAGIARRLLVSAFVVPLGLGAAAVVGWRADLYDVGTALPLFVWGMIVAFVLIIWRFALQLADVDVARAQAESELQAALAALRAEQDRKDVFLATLAHELRNPLAPISGAAEVLLHDASSAPEVRRRLSGIVATQVGHIVDLVNDLMDVERVSRGKLALDRHVLDLRTPIGDAYEQARPLIERKRHGCALVLPPAPVFVCGDHKRLVQIVVNLLNNAAKYTPAGGLLQLRLIEQGRDVAIAVTDNGIGIPPHLLDIVFDTFTQAALTPDRAEGGLGLGLSLVRRLAELHGGTVSAASPGDGKGSIFTVTLPRVTAAGGPAHV